MQVATRVFYRRVLLVSLAATWQQRGDLRMTVFSFHLAKTELGTTARALWSPPTPQRVIGLHHAECLSLMTLGAPILSPARMQLHRLAMFAAWESATAIDDFLETTKLGRELADGWHVRLAFQRRWGHIRELNGLVDHIDEQPISSPVIAVTLARMRLLQVPRFIRWGRPVEQLVRDAPGSMLALAAMRPPRTVSTFSIWASLEAMQDMVRGKSDMARPKRHADAMVERERKDFHFEFTTLRFRAISEHGTWEGRTYTNQP